MTEFNEKDTMVTENTIDTETDFNEVSEEKDGHAAIVVGVACFVAGVVAKPVAKLVCKGAKAVYGKCKDSKKRKQKKEDEDNDIVDGTCEEIKDDKNEEK